MKTTVMITAAILLGLISTAFMPVKTGLEIAKEAEKKEKLLKLKR